LLVGEYSIYFDQKYFYRYRRFHGKLCQPVKKEVDMRIAMIAVMLTLWLAVPGWADNGFKEGAREVGQGFKKLGKEFKECGKEVGQGFKRAGLEAGQEAKKTGRSIGEWFRDTGKKTGDTFRELGQNIRKFFTGKV
jgi:hypothetical protein